MALTRESMLLRRVLQANAVFSTTSGIALIGAAKSLSTFIGIDRWWILLVIGVVLLAFTVGLVLNSRRDSINEKDVVQAIVSDGVWVLGSAVVLFVGVLTTAGNWLVALVALVVFAFALLQAIGLHRIRCCQPARS